MSTKHFTPSDWSKIHSLAERSAHRFGLPKRRRKSVIIGSFNIRKLGSAKKRPAEAWKFLKFIAKRFDLLAVQEVLDDLSAIRKLHELVGSRYGLVVSDVTGKAPGSTGNPERLAFLFQWSRIRRTELASDIGFDRSEVLKNLLKNREPFFNVLSAYQKVLDAREREKKEGKKVPSKPALALPEFLTFIRTPHCAAFQVVSRGKAKPYEFMVVNAHLLYGKNKTERRMEFDALIQWLTLRAKMRDRMYHENMLLLGDCNLEFEDGVQKRDEIDEMLKRINKTALKSKKAAQVNFPLLTLHPKTGATRSNLKMDQGYDQIAIFANDKRLPDYKKNATAGATRDGFNYGVFRFTDLFAQALYNKTFAELIAKEQKHIITCTTNDISDHLPVWFRLPIPRT